MFHPVLQDILTSNVVTDAQGNQYPLHGGISEEEGRFIAELIRENGVQETIEIGCAYGISSLFICDALAHMPQRRHTIIDPHQTTYYKGIGVHGLGKAGFDRYDLIEDVSEFALPNLLKHGKKFDLALIDGWHTFDHALLDFFYVNRMLKVGGVVVFDDASWPAVHRVVRYVSSYPAYQVVGSVGGRQTQRQRLWYSFRRVIGYIFGRVPVKFRKGIFDDALFRPSEANGMCGSMVALRKVADDDRTWNWHAEF